jgi:hypothetical protein
MQLFPALDLVAKELETMLNVDNPRLLRMQAEACEGD